MSENDFNELEKFLLPFAFDRYKTDNPLAKLAIGLNQNRFNTMITWEVRAFIRCIYSVNQPILLQDITFIVIAEMSLMMNFPPYNTTTLGNRDQFLFILGAEIHRWFLHLEENNKLPGIYERFTGKYIPNNKV